MLNLILTSLKMYFTFKHWHEVEETHTKSNFQNTDAYSI